MKKRVTVDQNEVTPLHHQVYLVLRQSIEDGKYPSDRPMPSEPDLTEMFGVSRITIRRALDRLQSEDRIKRWRGRGTYPVIQQGPNHAKKSSKPHGAFDSLVAMGLQTKAKLIEFSYVLPPEEVRAALELPVGEQVQRAVRVRSLNGKPFSHLTTFVPESIGNKINSKDLEQKPLLLLLEEQGRKIDRATQAFSARLADPQTAKLLATSTGSALLYVKRLVRDTAGVPVEYLEALYRPDMYEYLQEFSRGDEGSELIWKPIDDSLGQKDLA